MKEKVIVVGNTAWYLANFRLSLMKKLQAEGYEVVAAAPSDEYISRFEEAGIRFVPIPMDNKGTNPVSDSRLFFRLLRILYKEAPMVFLGYTVKPNVYGGMACRLLKIPSVHNIAGLGTVFISDSWLTRLVKRLYGIGLRKARKVFFQNNDDLDLFLEHGLVLRDNIERLPGSGVDIERFKPMEPADSIDRPLTFLLLGRLLWDKGVGEFVEAARNLRAQGIDAQFQVLGFLSVENRAAISREQINDWEQEGIIEYLGASDDVRPLIAQADCVVLPSYYREGVPRSLLEAASMAKPIVTTDAVGCREVVDDGDTGFLCQPRDADDLAEKLLKLANMTHAARMEMGRNARNKMIREFNEDLVINRYLETIREISQENA